MDRYITLVGSVSGEVGNTLSRFTTRLPETLHLKADKHVIGLTEIIFSTSAQNFAKGGSYTIIYKDEKKQKRKYVKVPPGHYDTLKNLKNVLNKEGSGVVFDFLEDTHHVTVKFDSTVAKIWMNPDLTFSLGFEKSTITEAKEATHRMDYFNQQSVYYIYCDAITPSIVGNTQAELLQCVPVPREYGETVRYAFTPVRYLAPIQEHIDSIRIEILNEQGKPIQFSWGTVILVLHIKDK